jgi:hypothetical protein
MKHKLLRFGLGLLAVTLVLFGATAAGNSPLANHGNDPDKTNTTTPIQHREGN